MGVVDIALVIETSVVVHHEDLHASRLVGKDAAAASPVEITLASCVVCGHDIRSVTCPEVMPVRKGSWASEIAAHRLTSCGIRACGIFLGPGIKPMSPASAGRFLSIDPPGEPDFYNFKL